MGTGSVEGDTLVAVTVGQILALIDEMAPRELAENYDNVGL